MRSPGQMPPGLGKIALAGLGALALAVGLVAALNGAILGALVALCGAALLLWSVFGGRAR